MNNYNQDHRTQRLLCTAPPLQSEQLIEAWNDIHQIQLGPLHPMDLFPDIYSLDPESRLVTLDIQGLTRSIDNDSIVPKISPFINNALEMAHIIKADDHELALMLQYLNMSVHEIMAHYKLKEIVETKAEKGGRVYTPGDTYTFQAHPKKQIVDTTGAGDVFFAAYLFSRIQKKQNISEASKEAAATAAQHIEGHWIIMDELNIFNHKDMQ